MSKDQINRGGGWGTDSQYARVVVRDVLYPEFRLDDLGFRLVHDVGMVPVRGTMWSELRAIAVTVNYGRDKNLFSSSLGFRLAREET